MDTITTPLGCEVCRAACCRTGKVATYAPDIVRLSRHLDQPADELVNAFFRGTTYVSFAVGRDKPEVEWYVAHQELPPGTYSIDEIQAEKICPFLVESEGDTWPCRVYEARPGICRRYPYFSDGSFPKADPNHFCPHHPDPPMDELAWRSQVIKSTVEHNLAYLYQMWLADSWNAVVLERELSISTPAPLLDWLVASGEVYWEVKATFDDEDLVPFIRTYLPYENPLGSEARAQRLAEGARELIHDLRRATPAPPL